MERRGKKIKKKQTKKGEMGEEWRKQTRSPLYFPSPFSSFVQRACVSPQPRQKRTRTHKEEIKRA
jgi:hypothetical protein